MKLNEIISHQDPTKIVEGLKKRTNPLPRIEELRKEYFPQGHRIFDIVDRPDKPVKGTDGSLERFEKVARIALPLQRLIVDRAVAFLFGHPVKMSATPQNDQQYAAFETVKRTLTENKVDSLNRRIARTVMWETEAAELWYPVSENGFWNRVAQNQRCAFVADVNPGYKLRVAVFSPSCGDRLYPKYDQYGDMTAFGREYMLEEQDEEVVYFEVYTDSEIVRFRKDANVWEQVDVQPNILGKIPIVYARQTKSEWADVQILIERLEKLLSNFADTNDYHSSPKIFVTGEIRGFARKGETGAIIEGEQNSTAQYLSWQQAPESVRLEIETLLGMIYSTTQTPDISFDSVKGLGAVSGVALRMLFLDAHLKVQNKCEMFCEYLERRMSIIKNYIGVLNTTLYPHSTQVEVRQMIEPYMIDDKLSTIQTFTAASGGKQIISQRSAVRMAGFAEDPDQEFEDIVGENNKEAMENETFGL